MEVDLLRNILLHNGQIENILFSLLFEIQMWDENFLNVLNINTGCEKYMCNKLNSINIKISALFGVTKINGSISGYDKSASSRIYKLLLTTCINNTKTNGQIPKIKLDQRRRMESY